MLGTILVPQANLIAPSFTDWIGGLFASITLPIAKAMASVNEPVTNTLNPYQGSAGEAVADAYSQGMYHYTPNADKINIPTVNAPQTASDMISWTPDQAVMGKGGIDTNFTDASATSNWIFYGLIIGGALVITKVLR